VNVPLPDETYDLDNPEDGRRLFNIGTLAPDAIWSSVEADFDRLLGSFALDDVQGITVAPLRQMTSESAVDLSAGVASAVASPAVASPAIRETAAGVPAAVDQPLDDSAGDEPLRNEAPASDDRPTQAIDVALADDAASLDPDHPMNASLRDSGVGLVPRVIMVATREKFATVGAAAIEAMFRVPLGWHVIDDGRRTLVFDPDGSVRINLNLRTPLRAALRAAIERRSA
jgi:hypothetical protein